MTDDASDLKAAVAGDHQAFARLYDRHAAVVLSLCRYHLRSDTEADDALQDTFLRAYKKLDRLDRPEGLRSWLYAIARRVCAERRRADSRRARHEEQAVISRLNEPETSATVPGQVDKAERMERLDAAMDDLPDKERLAIHLHYLETDPPAAAASALGLSRSGFYKLLHRAREHLANSMRELPTR
ncbi:MAG: sigma-70 family RNA polymerase sigma factor [Planctomycetota bacterium]